MEKIILSPKYKLLFKDLKEVRTVLLAGGRGSGKSFARFFMADKFIQCK